MTDDRLALQTAIAPVAWGTTYIALSELLPPDRPLLAALGRALPAGLLLAALFRGRPQGAWWWKAPLLGLLNVGAFFALLLVSADRLPGGVTATFGAVGPAGRRRPGLGAPRHPAHAADRRRRAWRASSAWPCSC